MLRNHLFKTLFETFIFGQKFWNHTRIFDQKAQNHTFKTYFDQSISEPLEHFLVRLSYAFKRLENEWVEKCLKRMISSLLTEMSVSKNF